MGTARTVPGRRAAVPFGGAQGARLRRPDRRDPAPGPRNSNWSGSRATRAGEDGSLHGLRPARGRRRDLDPRGGGSRPRSGADPRRRPRSVPATEPGARSSRDGRRGERLPSSVTSPASPKTVRTTSAASSVVNVGGSVSRTPGPAARVRGPSPRPDGSEAGGLKAGHEAARRPGEGPA